MDEADRAIGEMKDLALALAGPILDTMAQSYFLIRTSEGAPSTNEEDIAHRDRIKETLEGLGASKGEVEAVLSKFDRARVAALRGAIRTRLHNSNIERATLFENGLEMTEWTRAQFEKFIEENGLKPSGEVEDLLRSLEQFTARLSE